MVVRFAILCSSMVVTKTIAAGSVVTMAAKKVDDGGKIPSNVLMCRQWWKVCWIYGDQEKYYRYLYGGRKNGADREGAGDQGGLPKISSATSTTTALVTLQQQNLIFQNAAE